MESWVLYEKTAPATRVRNYLKGYQLIYKSPFTYVTSKIR